jgi:hypothetical protein
MRPVSPHGSQRSLEQINNTIRVFDIINQRDKSVHDFYIDQEEDGYNPFIIRDPTGSFHGEATNWPYEREFIECADDTPSAWLGFSYNRHFKKKFTR